MDASCLLTVQNRPPMPKPSFRFREPLFPATGQLNLEDSGEQDGGAGDRAQDGGEAEGVHDQGTARLLAPAVPAPAVAAVPAVTAVAVIAVIVTVIVIVQAAQHIVGNVVGIASKTTHFWTSNWRDPNTNNNDLSPNLPPAPSSLDTTGE